MLQLLGTSIRTCASSIGTWENLGIGSKGFGFGLGFVFGVNRGLHDGRGAFEEAWRQEKAAPEILQFESALIRRIAEQIQLMEEIMEEFTDSGINPLIVSLYKMDLDRTQYLSSSFGNSSNSIPGTGRSNLGPVSGDMNNGVLNDVANSGLNVGASSLITDANSVLSGGPHLQKSASINNESYMRLPASPMSFSSNNISMSWSSIVDRFSVVKQSSQHD
ncbi:hypothetical protein FF1_025569 [Malus domestica]